VRVVFYIFQGDWHGKNDLTVPKSKGNWKLVLIV